MNVAFIFDENNIFNSQNNLSVLHFYEKEYILQNLPDWHSNK